MENTLQYKGYFTNIFFSVNDNVLYGKIEGIDDLITFESKSATEIEKEFHDAVDDYLDFCAEIGKEPSKAYKGTFNVRIDPKLHREIAINAAKNGMSLNQAVEQAIYQYVAIKNDNRSEYIASIEHQLSEITGALGMLSTSCPMTYTSPEESYVTSILPLTANLWNGGKS